VGRVCQSQYNREKLEKEKCTPSVVGNNGHDCECRGKKFEVLEDSDLVGPTVFVSKVEDGKCGGATVGGEAPQKSDEEIGEREFEEANPEELERADFFCVEFEVAA